MFFSTSIFVQNCQLFGKKIEILWEILTFSNNCALLVSGISYWKTCLFSENFDFLCECLYSHNLIKTSIFLRKCLFVHVLIFIRVFLLLENCYFDSKYDFIRWYFGKKCHFPSKIYISGGINFFGEIEQFLRKGVNLAVNFRKNDNWY